MGPPQVEVTVVQSDIESHMDIVSHTYWQWCCSIGEYSRARHTLSLIHI